jgi:hypothetical protein
MPQAFSVAYGLDLGTEVSSFWSWLHDTQAMLDGAEEGSALVREIVQSQRDQIARVAGEQADAAAARFCLTVAMALLGSHYASNQKLLNGLRDQGLLALGGSPGIFDTIGEPPLEESGREQ